MKVQITGDRWWQDEDLIRDTLLLVGATEVVEGDCRGADRLAASAARSLGLAIHTIPADWEGLGLSAGPVRNAKMAREHPDAGMVLAFHDDISRSSGTRQMIFDVCLPAGRTILLTCHVQQGLLVTPVLEEYFSAYPDREVSLEVKMGFEPLVARYKFWLTERQTSLRF